MRRMTKRFFPGDTVLVTIGMVPTGTNIMTPHTLMTTVGGKLRLPQWKPRWVKG